MRFLIALLLLATPSVAEPMTGAEFEAYATGRTLDFAMNGEVYGTEQYLPNRRVRWAFRDGECLNGFWYEKRPREICFVYEGNIGEQCWHYSATETGMIAEFLGASDSPDVYVAGDNPDGLYCRGPDLGV